MRLQVTENVQSDKISEYTSEHTKNYWNQKLPHINIIYTCQHHAHTGECH